MPLLTLQFAWHISRRTPNVCAGVHRRGAGRAGGNAVGAPGQRGAHAAGTARRRGRCALLGGAARARHLPAERAAGVPAGHRAAPGRQPRHPRGGVLGTLAQTLLASPHTRLPMFIEVCSARYR
jgi:hypothetical protein